MVQLEDHVSDSGDLSQCFLESHHGFELFEPILGRVGAFSNCERPHFAPHVDHRVRDAVLDLGEIDAASHQEDPDLGIDAVVGYGQMSSPLSRPLSARGLGHLTQFTSHSKRPVVDGTGFPDTIRVMRTPCTMVLVVTGLFGCAPAAVDKHPPPAPVMSSQAPPEAHAPPTERAALPRESAELDQDAERQLLDQHPQNVNQAAALLDAWTMARAVTRIESLRDHTPEPEPWWRESDLKHAHVAKWKETFSTSQERSLKHWIEDASPYAPHVREILREEGVPEELWVLTLLESGFRPEARSHQAAVGPWQFLGATARHTGLIMTAERDQRRDWEDATRAACRYLKELRAEFGSGLLALAAFNCGPGRVHRALAQTKKRSFWALDLPRETERYVPRALALVSLVGNGDNDPFRMDPDDALDYDRVTLPHSVSVESLARVCDTSPAELRKLNPSWLRSMTPGDGHPVVARVPDGKQDDVRDALEDGKLNPKPAPEVASAREHRVVTGDTLWSIAKRYGTRLESLRQANGLSASSLIRPGQVLRIPG